MLSYPCISKSVQVIRTSYTPLSWTTRSHNDHVDHRASSKLFADAEHEERTSVALTRTSIHQGTTSEHPNWTGDESIEDAVLRMLVDKYKPLRTGKIRTAEEKMHRAPPQNSCVTSRNDAYVHVRRRTPIFFWPPCSSSRRTDLACSGGPQAVAYEVQGTLARNCVDSLWSYSYCWHRIILYKLRAGSCSSRADGRRSHTSQRARGQEAIRNCRTVDYRLGITKNIKSGMGMQTPLNPVSVKGWAGLVEARIEVRCALSMIMKPDPSLSYPASQTRRTLPHHQGPRETP